MSRRLTPGSRLPRTARRAAIGGACVFALVGLTGCFHDDEEQFEGDGITEITNWTGVNDTPPAPTETDLQRSNPEGNEPVLPGEPLPSSPAP